MKKDNMKHNNKTVIKSNIKNVQSVDKKMNFRKDLPAIILAVCMIFWTVGSLISFVLGARSCGDRTIEASAESYNDYPIYSTTNLLKASDGRQSGVTNGITLTRKATGEFVFNGTATANSVFYIYDSSNQLPYDLESGDTFSVRVNGPLAPNYCIFACNYYYNGSFNNALINMSSDNTVRTSTIPINTVGIQMYFYMYAGSTFENSTFSCMLNKGNVSYPYSPNPEYYYSVGYDLGETQGYNDGRLDGLKKGDISFLYGATATLDFARYGANDSASGNLYVDGSQVSFSGIISNYTSVSNITARIDLATATNGRNIYWVAYGNRSAFYDGDSPKVFTAVTSDGSTYSARWNYIADMGYYGLQLSTGGVYDIELSYLRNWYIGSATDLQSIYFRAPNSAYRSGYDLGYTDGLNDNSYVLQAFQNGQDLGFKNGFEKGKTYGIEHANDYSFTGLLSAVFDVPIKAFRGLLNFEVLGVNLSGFYLSLLTACFVLVVIKLVM